MDRARANNRVRVAARAFALMSLLGCSAIMADESLQIPFEKAWSEVDAVRQQAADVGYEWLETRSLLEQAQEAYAAQQESLARSLLKRARLQAQQSLAQAEREQAAWTRRVVR